MTKNKALKRSLIVSVLLLLVYVAMLLGSTYAWFTEQLVSGSNVIRAGKLDIALEKWNVADQKWSDASGARILDYDLWEPGYTEVVNLRVVNHGNLALQWQASITTADELSALADVINVYVRSDDRNDTVREYISGITNRSQFDILAAHGEFKKFTLREFVENLTIMTKGVLGPEQKAYLGVVLSMDTAAGNEYKGMDLCGGFEFKLYATQYTYEYDSFDDQYDANADYYYHDRNYISNLQEHRQAAAAGGEYYLSENIVIGKNELTVAVKEDFVLHLNEKNIDASEMKGRPFEAYDGVDFTINGKVHSDTSSAVGEGDTVKVGLYGLVNIPADNNVSVTLNGGKYVGKTDNGSFIKPRGNGKISIIMNGAVSVDDSTNGSFIIDTAHYTGSQFSLLIDGGYYKANKGLNVPYAIIKNATVVSTGNTSQHSAIVAQYSSKSAIAGIQIENCDIIAKYAIAVANGCTANVSNSTITVPDTGYALVVLGTGGTIRADGISYSGKVGTTGKVSDDALIYIDGSLVYEKHPN